MIHRHLYCHLGGMRGFCVHIPLWFYCLSAEMRSSGSGNQLTWLTGRRVQRQRSIDQLINKSLTQEIDKIINQ